MGFLSNFEETSQQEEKSESENQDDASSALYHQPFLNEKQRKVFYFYRLFKIHLNFQKTVEIEKIKKNFGSVTAVEDLTLSLYESQLFWYTLLYVYCI